MDAPASPAPPSHAGADRHAVLAGVVAAVVGLTSSFAVVLAGLRAVGASEHQAASGLIVLCVTMGLMAIVLAWRTRMPIMIAWSTPGAALLVSAGHVHGGYPAAIGAFLVGGVLTILAGLSRPFGRLIAAIPTPVGSAMLAGVLLSLCVEPVRALARPARLRTARRGHLGRARPVRPPVGGRGRPRRGRRRDRHRPARARRGSQHRAARAGLDDAAPDAGAVVGLAIPLFVVTMAAQNIPGMAVLASFGYRPDLREPLLGTGAATVVGAPFGAHAVNLAAIIAGLVAGPEAHPDPSRRWIAAASCGAATIALGLGAGVITALAALAPPLLFEAVAGLALLRTLGAALADSLAAPAGREAALITFVVAASGVTLAGVAAPFWALIAGVAMTALRRA